MKRSKNIFNSMIAPENLLESEGNRENKIGELPINSNWLKGVRAQQYRPYIISALKLSQLQKQLDDLKEDQVSSPTKQGNLFKMSKTKKKIDQLALQATEDNKPLQQYLAKNQPPQTEDLIMQKMSQGFFKSLLQRKCKISDKQLYIQSMKDDNNKWIKIGILGYNLEFEEQEKLLDKPEFAQFKWIAGSKQRILLWAPDKKNFCLYGKLDHLKKFQRYFQVQNIEVKQLNVFKSLDVQLKQKIIVYFGKNVRFYDYCIRIRRNQKDAQLDTFVDQKRPQRKQGAQGIREEKQRQKSSEVGHSSQLGQSSQFSQSSKLESQFLNTIVKTADKGGTGSIALDVNKSQKKQKKSPEKQKQKGDGEVFKLKLKSSIMFYNQIKEPVEFNDEQYKVEDLKLNLRDEIGISDVDEESQSRSAASFKKQKQQPKKKVTRLTVRNVLDNQQKFSINIYEASQQQKAVSSEKKQNQFDLDIPQLARSSSANLSEFIQASNRVSSPKSKEGGKFNLSELRNIPAIYKSKNIRQFQDSDYLQFQKARPPDESFSDFQSDLQRSFTPIHQLDRQINKIKNQKKIGEIDIYEASNKQEIYCTVAFVEMFVPYNSDHLQFQILQVDPQLEMQGKIVTCGRGHQVLREKKKDNQKYTLYQNQEPCHFRFSKASNKFIFVLVQDTKCHYLPFEMDVNLKYKKNESQLLISQLDRQGYPFAAFLGLYASPNPIHLGPRLKTTEFMQKYLNDGENYDFKHDFINDKKRLQMIRKEWNKKIAKNSLREGDPQAFGKAVFLGLNDSIFKSLKKKVNYDPNKLFSFTDNEYRLIEENVVTGLIDLKSFLKPLYLIKLIAQGLYNEFIKQRLEHVYVYFLNRYGSVRNLALVFVKEILQKLEPILVCCRREEQVNAVVKLYFEVQYEIDELFLKISNYFKK